MPRSLVHARRRVTRALRRGAAATLGACLCVGLFLGLAGSAQAEPAAEPSVAAAPAALPSAAAAATLPLLRQGYAFDTPNILIRQRLFGLAHGVSLLAAACLDLPEQAAVTENAYAAWHAAQEVTIDRLVADLAVHHFGPRSADATWQDLARALNLKDSIAPALGGVPLADACASLPEALARPRYDLFHLLEEADAPVTPATASPVVSAPTTASPTTPAPATATPLAPAAAAGDAVPPAPTFAEPTAAPTPP